MFDVGEPAHLVLNRNKNNQYLPDVSRVNLGTLIRCIIDCRGIKCQAPRPGEAECFLL